MEGVRLGIEGAPVAQQTKLGWVLSGKIRSTDPSRNLSVTSFHTKIESLMENFLTIEAVEEAKSLSVEEQWCEQFFADTHRRDESGRFEVRLPFRFLFDYSATLGRSRDIAIKRLHQLERRFAQDAQLKSEYSKAINEYLQLGRMQPTASADLERPDRTCTSSYLPHHAVVKESSTSTKLRVVFDASRKTTNGKSLNDILVVGPTIQSDIVTIIMNWRFHRVAFTADVQKMYLQVKVDPRDIEFQRIVWRDDPSEPIRDYALNRLTFGTSCAPYIAIKAIKQLAETEKDHYPEAANIISNDAYVDDVISGGDDVQTVQKLQKDLVTMMQLGGFDLKKWASNVSEVLQQVPEADRELQLPVELNPNQSIKALGIAWNTASDSFGFTAALEDTTKRQFTKRSVLSSLAKLFDPIGLIAPVIVVGKIIMKKVWCWQPVLDWDDALPPALNDEWLSYIEGLRHIAEIKIPRWINASTSAKSIQLHGFCDASKSAYGAAIYVRVIDSDDQIHTHLISSKSKIAPKRALTIPRLELCAAHLLSKLLVSTRKSLRHISLSTDDIRLYGDSEIVWYWLRSEKQLKVFVENLVGKINSATTGIQWRHVSTNENPADLVSRGISPQELANNALWWHGPSWLRLPEPQWPVSRIDATHPPKDVDLELRRIVQANLCSKDIDIIHEFSSYSRLIRISALCKRFATNIRLKKQQLPRLVGILTVDELQWVRRHWILQTQKQVYSDEIHALSQPIPAPIDKQSNLHSLVPFVDGNGILRVRGRLEHSTLNYDQRHPIILPPKHHFTNLIIDRYHQRTLHGGPQLTASLLRREYWIVRERDAVRHRIHRCIICHRHRATTAQQLMGSLPSAKVRRTQRPFLHTGVDYCGPFDLRASKGRGQKSYKGYVSVFVCLTTKAVHIECVDGLTTDAFLAVFHRFVSRRGLPSDMYSDNGTNFVGAAKEINKLHDQLIQQSEQHIANIFVESNVRWHFIPPGSPHMGGAWEANIKSFKHHFRRIIGETRLTYEELHTMTTQIEACMNSRPICALTADPNDMAALTPGHFLIGSELLAVAEPSLLDRNPKHLTRWRMIQHMKQQFWQHWRDDYLSLLRQRPKWCREQHNIQVGELVLVKDDRYPSYKWALGRIERVHPGTDDLVRVVTVRTASGTYKRNITKISRLPIDYTTDEPESQHEVIADDNCNGETN